MKTLFCKKYPQDKVLPNENGKCSLCGGNCTKETTKEKHFIVTFSRTYEIPESKIKERITEYCNVGETADDLLQTGEEWEELVKDCAEEIASDLISQEMEENSDNIKNFFSVTHSPSVVIY